jgi:hypothetical protein
MEDSKNLNAGVMAFFHIDGFVPAYTQTRKFAGENGRIATLPDIISARLATVPGTVPWERYFTTMSAEYMGVTRGGKKIIIVAHGIGPMRNLDGALKTYSYHFKDKTRSCRGGRITLDEFWELESGKYGDVSVVDYESYASRYEYPFIQILTSDLALTDPLLKARFGNKAEEYVLRHKHFAVEWHKKQAGFDPENRYQSDPKNWEKFLDRRRRQHAMMGIGCCNPYIIEVSDASNCFYSHYKGDDGLAYAHLLSLGQLMHSHHEGRESLVCDCSCHGWYDGTRLVGVRANSELTGIHPGADARKLLYKNWQSLMKKVDNPIDVGFCGLIKVNDNTWFAQYPKQGDDFDTHEPEYLVRSITPVSDLMDFVTKITGHHMFFTFNIKEVMALAPPMANAYYFMGEPALAGNDHHRALVQFYKVEVDNSQRLMREKELENNYELMMELLPE